LFCSLEPLGEVRPGCNPSLEEPFAIPRDFGGSRCRENDCDVDDIVSDLREAEIALRVDVHLSHSAHSSDATVMGHQPDAARPGPRADESEAPPDDRAKAVSTDDETTPELTRFATRLDNDTGHARAVIAYEVDDACTFLDAGTRMSGAPQQDVVENRSSEREPTVSECRESLDTRELGVDSVRIRGAEMHPCQLRGAGRLDFLEHAHVREYSGRLRTQVFGADFVARKTRAVDHEDVDPRCRQGPRRRSTGGSATNDDDVGVSIVERQPTARDTR
jgi:hypothetical protein